MFKIHSGKEMKSCENQIALGVLMHNQILTFKESKTV